MTQNTFHLELNFIQTEQKCHVKTNTNQDNEYQFEINSIHTNF